jgi:hypothetical protein
MMGIERMASRHQLRHFRDTVTSGAAGGKVVGVVELGTKKGTVNPDSDFESPEFGTRNEQISASIYFAFDPQVRTNDYLQILSVYQNGGYRAVTNGPIYRVESVIDFQTQNRLWRVRATKREAI